MSQKIILQPKGQVNITIYVLDISAVFKRKAQQHFKHII